MCCFSYVLWVFGVSVRNWLCICFCFCGGVCWVIRLSWVSWFMLSWCRIVSVGLCCLVGR